MLTKTNIQTLRRLPSGESRIKKAAELSGITQTALARDLGFPTSYVCDVSQRRFRTITVANAFKFARYFNCAIEDLFPDEAQGAA
jgi:DNA-binding XRE family transcriptional regulator